MSPRALWPVFAGASLLAVAGFVIAPPAVAANRALIVTVDDYADDRLDSAAADAAANDGALIRKMLVDKLDFKDGDIQTLSDADATKGAILQGIDAWLASGTAAGDHAYFYFAGQGYFATDQNGDEADGLDEALVPHDANSEGKDIAGVISDDELTAAFKSLGGRKVTIVLDSGFSGRVTRSEEAVTRSIRVTSKGKVVPRTPDLETLTRAIKVEPRVKQQKAEVGSGFLEGYPDGAQFAEWVAASPSQTAYVDAASNHGVFTELYVDGRYGKADEGGDGEVTPAELLRYTQAGSDAYCKVYPETCEMGLTPTLYPAAALTVAVKQHGLTLDSLKDLIGRGNVDGIGVEQNPPSPVAVGARNIKIKVSSPIDGHLVLLDLADTGELIQLYPNQYSRKKLGDGFDKIRAGSPVQIPDAYYGISFNAKTPGSGYLIAIISADPVDYGAAITTRAIKVMPREKAEAEYLPALAEALSKPVYAHDEAGNTAAAKVSVATVRYEILP